MAVYINDPLCNLLGTWSAEVNMFSILLRIAISVLLGACIGCDPGADAGNIDGIRGV